MLHLVVILFSVLFSEIFKNMFLYFFNNAVYNLAFRWLIRLIIMNLPFFIVLFYSYDTLRSCVLIIYGDFICFPCRQSLGLPHQNRMLLFLVWHLILYWLHWSWWHSVPFICGLWVSSLAHKDSVFYFIEIKIF